MTSPTDSARVDALDRVQVYQLAMSALADAKRDADEAKHDSLSREVASQLLRAIASIAANVAEGYSRGTPADRRRFFEYALGSTRESRVWYAAMPAASTGRLDRLESIRRLLLAMIRNARLRAPADGTPFSK